MPSLLDIGISGLFSNQAALNTASHNISNANTEGFSRQRVSQLPQNPQFITGNYFGSGVEVGQVIRLFDQTHQLEIQAATASFMSLEAYLAEAGRVDGLLADSQNGLDTAIQSFFSALQDVVNDPSSIAGREVFLGQANNLINRFGSIHAQLNSQLNQINKSIDTIAEEVSSLGQSIARLNAEIVGSPGDPPPDLLDKRDLAVVRLSELVSVQTITQDDDSLTVFIGSGQSLVIGNRSSNLVASNSSSDPKTRILSLQSGNSSIEITNNLNGGQLGGLLNVVNEIISPAFNTLGRVAVAVADSFNQQSRLGLDFNGDLGGDFFTDINDATLSAGRVGASSNNTGTANLSINIDDLSQLGDSDFTLFLQGGNYQLVDQTTNVVVATFAPPGAVPANVAIAGTGISIDFISGAGVNGDAFNIQPVRNFSRDFSVAISNVNQIATASPIRAERALTNVGSGIVQSVSITDTSTVQFTGVANDLNPPISIVFDAPPGVAGEFSIFDISGAIPVLIAGGISGYIPNQDNDMLALAGAPFNAFGYEISLAGEPQPGDSFDFTYNINGTGNNENAALLGELQQLAVLDNGSSNFQQAFSRIIGRVGISTQTAQIQRDAAESILFQSKERRESLSGVNLDEEAANLLKFQQAYQASAEIISVARTLFQTVLNAVQ